MHSTESLTSNLLGDHSVSKKVGDILNILPSQLEQLKPATGSLDVSKEKVSSSAPADVSDDQIYSHLSLDDCGTGFEVVKVTEQDTLHARSSDNRIVHGNQTHVPWQVFIRGEGESHVTCGGSLINRQWVLTAAHCDVSPRDSLFIGLTKAPTARDKSSYQIDQVLQHPEYDEKSSTNDFTLIKLKSPVRLSSNPHSDSAINCVCLPVPGSEFGRIEGWVSGYGHIKSKKGPYSPYLLSTRVSILSKAACNRVTMDSEKYTLDDGQFCAAGTRVMGGKDVSQLCQGDSGGPLIVKTRAGRSLLIGIVSFAYDICAEPGFFVKVSHAVDWIARALKAN